MSGISLASRRKLGKDGIDLSQLLLRDVNQFSVLVHSLGSGSTRDRDDCRHPWTLRDGQNPVDGELGRRAALLRGSTLNLLNELEVDCEVLRIKAGEVAEHRVLGDVVKGLDLSRQQAPADGRVCDEGDAVLGARSSDSVLQYVSREAERCC